MTPESRIKNEIMSFLKTIGVFCWVNDSVGIWDAKKKTFRKSNSPFKIKGVSDIIGLINGRFLAIEVKSKAGSLTPEQRIFLAQINNEGGIAFCSRSVAQTADNLLKFFPHNDKLKKFSNEYIESKGEH